VQQMPSSEGLIRSGRDKPGRRLIRDEDRASVGDADMMEEEINVAGNDGHLVLPTMMIRDDHTPQGQTTRADVHMFPVSTYHHD